ncbi:Rz-like spanin [Pseudomonas phage PspYZU05]|uniref:I-spanin n=1 Tax=Pseudomonas phage PspYZU05 TaxID=1983556 RepID=A0A2U7NRY3_9CAUD|nr:Rz-like spanin [Pseudomonas phage PspYZU05]ASD52012.1 hypothetical protein PspYZU05_60 [Pseudomonas phage PspYZU05]
MPWLNLKTIGIIAILAFVLRTLWLDHQVGALTTELATTSAKYETLKESVDSIKDINTGRQERREQLTKQNNKLNDDANRENLLLEKPKLVESLIGKSIFEFMEKVEDQTK